MSLRTPEARHISRPDWLIVRDHVDIEALAVALLGPPVKRTGNDVWWLCPFHDERTPSFKVSSKHRNFRCFGCDARGDAAELLGRREGIDFPTAVARLAEGAGVSGFATSSRPRPAKPTPPALPPGPGPAEHGLDPDQAEELVMLAADRLWTPAGVGALDNLLARGLRLETIRAARLGFNPHIRAITKEGKPFVTGGIVIPWIDFRGRVELVKVRRLGPVEPKYHTVAVKGREPVLYVASPIRPGRPAVVVEGELDAAVMAEAVGDLAAVVTGGGTGTKPTAPIVAMLLPARPWHIAFDADGPGRDAVPAWLEACPRAVHLKMPVDGVKDWCDLHASGRNRIRYYIAPALGWTPPPMEALLAERWGPAIDPEQSASCDRYDALERELIQAEDTTTTETTP